jgi:hypothetical protein
LWEPMLARNPSSRGGLARMVIFQALYAG